MLDEHIQWLDVQIVFYNSAELLDAMINEMEDEWDIRCELRSRVRRVALMKRERFKMTRIYGRIMTLKKLRRKHREILDLYLNITECIFILYKNIQKWRMYYETY